MRVAIAIAPGDSLFIIKDEVRGITIEKIIMSKVDGIIHCFWAVNIIHHLFSGHWGSWIEIQDLERKIKLELLIELESLYFCFIPL